MSECMNTEYVQDMLQRIKSLEQQKRDLQTSGINTPENIDSMQRIDTEIAQNQLLIQRIPPVNATKMAVRTYNITYPEFEVKLLLTENYHKRYPDEGEWKYIILPEIEKRFSECEALGSKDVYMDISAHPTIGLALGFMFRSTTGYNLWIRQQSDTWFSEAKSFPEKAIKVEPKETSRQGDDISIEISISNNIKDDVDHTISQLNLPIKTRVTCVLPGEGNHITDARHAVTIARDIRQTILAYNKTRYKSRVHLFAAIPIALSVLIGRELNACGAIQIYEHRKEVDHLYTPACLLRG